MTTLLAKLQDIFHFGKIPRLGWFFASLTLVTELGFFCLFPVLGVLLQHTHGMSLAQVALPVTVFTVATRCGFLFAPLIAKIGKLETWLALSLIEAAASFLLLAFAKPLWLVLVLLTMAGLGISLYLTVARTFIAETITEPSENIKTFAILNLALNASASLGPILGAFLIAHSLGQWVYGIIAATYLLSAAIIYFVFRRYAGAQPGSTENFQASMHWSELFTVFFQHARFRRFAIGNALGYCLYAQLFATIPLYFVSLHGDKQSLGTLFTLNAILVVCLQMPISSLIARVTEQRGFPLERFLSIAYIIFALAFFVISAVGHSIIGMFVAVAFFTIGELFFTPVGHALVASMGSSGRHILFFSARSISDAIGEGVGVYFGIRLIAELQQAQHGNWYWLGLCTLGCIGGVLVWFFLPQPKPEAIANNITQMKGSSL